MVAARAVTRELAMSSPQTPCPEGHARPLDPRTLQPNSPSCGNQPAHISLTARRPDTHATADTGRSSQAPNSGAQTKIGANCALPLDRQALHIS